MRSPSAFIEALWTGMAAPCALYEPPPDYMAYAYQSSMGDSFTRVGILLTEAMGQVDGQVAQAADLTD